MKRLLIIGAAIAVAADQGWAVNLPRLDSSKFDFCYEMMESPTEQDLDNDGVADMISAGGGGFKGVDNGYGILNCWTVGGYFGSDKSAGSAGGVWQRYGITAATGFTIETRLRVGALVSEKIGAISLTAGDGGDSPVNAFLSFTTNAISWGTSGQTVLTNIDTKAAFHTYRIVRPSGANTYSVYVDGNLVASNLGNGVNGNDNRILIGAIGGNWRGVVYVGYLRFTKGGYAPPKEKDMRLDSSDFDRKYEMDSKPASFNKHGTISNVSSSGGATHFEFSANGYYDDGDWSGFSAMAKEYGYTVELRAKVLSSSSDRGIALTVSDGLTYDTLFSLTGSSVMWGGSAITNLVTTDDFHAYRVAKLPDNDQFILWCDGNLVSNTLTDAISGGAMDRFLFGAIGSAYGGKIDVDYLRYTSGVYFPPVPPKGFVLSFH